MPVRPHVLLISPRTELSALARMSLLEGGWESFEVEGAGSLHAGLQRLTTAGVDAILLDLVLPDSAGLPTLQRVFLAAPHIPILVLGDDDSRALFRTLLQAGAQDCLVRTRINSDSLARALNGAIGRKIAEDALFLERERAQVTLNSIGDAVLSTDVQGRITYLNAVAERLTGWNLADARGRDLRQVFNVISAVTRAVVTDPILGAIAHDHVIALSADSVLIQRSGAEVPIEDSVAPIHGRGGDVSGAVIVFHDVSESRSIKQRMAYLAQHDFLTDLPNRVLLNERLQHALDLGKRHQRRLAVMFLDLDHLKHINDSLGHSVGDQLLTEVARRLLACVRGSDTVSRQGGDEFVVLLSEIEQPSDVVAVAEKIRTALAGVYDVADHALYLTASIGVSIYPEDGDTAELLTRNADTAMYQAKADGRDTHRFFSVEMNLRATERQSVEEGLRQALARQEFFLQFQPKVDLGSGCITGAEALIRWRHPERGVLLPSQFIPIAEDCGLIVQIGAWVLETACRQARDWMQAASSFTQISINISAHEFVSKGFYERVCQALGDNQLPAGCVELELTETALMRDADGTVRMLGALHALGVRLAVDDFGTGYSSLSYLKRFPITTLKIDQSFVRDVTIDEDDANIVTAMVAIGHSLRQQVVAEGIEQLAQLAFLQSLQCQEGQGFLFSQPLDADRFGSLLAEGGLCAVTGITWPASLATVGRIPA